MMQTLDNLLMLGKIPTSEYLRRLPNGQITDRETLIAITEAAVGAGVTSILVKAIDNHNFWLKLRHVAEKPFIFLARKRRIQYDQH